MIFGGIQKLTLLDFPGMAACILFTKGCNFRCPFCHNASLVTHTGDSESITADEVMAFLKKRSGMLDGVAITGGEPLMHTELEDVIREIRGMGYKIKLDTNGTFPDRLERLISEKMLDYIAMDIKSNERKYALVAGADGMYGKVCDSIKILKDSGMDFEFRTTVVKELHEPDDFHDIGRIAAGDEKYYLQRFKDTGDTIQSGLNTADDGIMNQCLDILKNYVPHACIR